MKMVTFISMCLLFIVSVSYADWQSSVKNCWEQSPDLSPTGIDVAMSYLMADDFRCAETGPITGISIWVSFFDDVLPKDGADSLAFALAIHPDIPADPEYPWSRPEDVPIGPPKEFGPGQYTVIQVADNILEDWFDPMTGEWSNDNHQQAYRYDFDLTEDPFMQEEDTIYWLAVYLLNSNPDEFSIGWKTTKARDPDLRWNDDAVYNFFMPAVDVPSWQPLTYPTGHEYVGESLDLAFVITPEPASMLLLGLGGLALLRKRR